MNLRVIYIKGIIMKRFVMLLGFALLLAAAPVHAADNCNVSKLVVSGDGKVSATPDQATIVLGVETRNVSASVAAAENAKLMNKTVNALLSAGINKSDIQTSTYSLSLPTENGPMPTSAKGNTTKPLQFVATNQVTVRTNDTQGVGTVLDAAISAGSNSIQSVSFDLRDSKPQMDRALKLAIEDAQRKAKVIASAAGVKLGKILEVSGGYSYTAPAASYDLLAAAAPTPILPGQMDVTASISITYEIS
jgi:uncharacterized protein YggE